MESNNSKKRGRPATGRARTGVVFKRVPKEEEGILRELVDAAMDRALDKWQEKNAKYLNDAGWYLNQLDKAGRPKFEQIAIVAPEASQDSKYLEQIRQLLENVDNLTKQVTDLENQLATRDAGGVSDESEEVIRLRAENSRLVSKIKEYEQMYG